MTDHFIPNKKDLKKNFNKLYNNPNNYLSISLSLVTIIFLFKNKTIVKQVNLIKCVLYLSIFVCIFINTKNLSIENLYSKKIYQRKILKHLFIENKFIFKKNFFLLTFHEN